ncbi:MAG: hypothetical protein KIT79_03325 [Deltaproteobacteria bacterium]|nr:hypothetical protein [Deltaproteobacteria bacterium]
MVYRRTACLFLFAAALAACAAPRDDAAARKRDDAARLFRMLVTIEVLEPVTGSSQVWKAAVRQSPDSRTVGLLERTLGGGRFTAYDVEAGPKVYRARFAGLESGDPTVEILWTQDGKNYPVRIGAPEGYGSVSQTDYLDTKTRQLVPGPEGSVDIVVTPEPVILRWTASSTGN